MKVAMATHGDVERLMRRPYHRTLWTFLQVKEHERIDQLRQRASDIGRAGLQAIAFHEPKKLADQHHSLRADLGMIRTPEQTIENAADVMEAVRQIDAGMLKTDVITPALAPEADLNG